MMETKMREGAQPSSDFYERLEILIIMARKRGIPLPQTTNLEELREIAETLIKQRETHFKKLISRARRIRQRIQFLKNFLKFIENGGENDAL